MPDPTKAEIAQFFKRLRSQADNKQCFDCGAKVYTVLIYEENHTWNGLFS